MFDAFRSSPGFVFGGGEDGTERKAEPQGSADASGFSAQPGGDFPDLRMGFAQRETNVYRYNFDVE